MMGKNREKEKRIVNRNELFFLANLRLSVGVVAGGSDLVAFILYVLQLLLQRTKKKRKEACEMWRHQYIVPLWCCRANRWNIRLLLFACYFSLIYYLLVNFLFARRSFHVYQFSLTTFPFDRSPFCIFSPLVFCWMLVIRFASICQWLTKQTARMLFVWRNTFSSSKACFAPYIIFFNTINQLLFIKTDIVPTLCGFFSLFRCQ